MLPVHYPKELLTALDVLAVELWGPPGRAARRRRRPDPDLRLRASRATRSPSWPRAAPTRSTRVLFPHTCDSIQGLATLAPDFGGWSEAGASPSSTRRATAAPSARAFVEAELRALAGDARGAGRARRSTPDRLAAAIRLHRRDRRGARGAARRAARALADDRPRSSTRCCAAASGSGRRSTSPSCGPRAARSQPAAGAARASRCWSPATCPSRWRCSRRSNGAGAFVAADDYAAVGRRVPRPRRRQARRRSLGRALDRVLGRAAVPDPRRRPGRAACATSRRCRAQRRARACSSTSSSSASPSCSTCRRSGRRFAARGVPVLVPRGRARGGSSPAQAVTRIEAFVEMLSAGRAA